MKWGKILRDAWRALLRHRLRSFLSSLGIVFAVMAVVAMLSIAEGAKQEILDLLLESLSEPDPREILIYGMYVKKCLSPIIRAKTKDNIEKTLELLKKTLGTV